MYGVQLRLLLLLLLLLHGATGIDPDLDLADELGSQHLLGLRHYVD